MTEDERLSKRKAFIDKRRHELAGLVLDGSTFNRTGGELALWCRNIMYRTDAMLVQMFDELFPPPAKSQVEAENKQPPKR